MNVYFTLVQITEKFIYSLIDLVFLARDILLKLTIFSFESFHV